MSAYTSRLLLPWESSSQEDKRFYRILRYLLIGYVVLAVAVPLIPVPELEREEKEKLPPQLAKVILEKQNLPEPKPEPKTTTPKPKPEPKEELIKPKKVVKKKPVEKKPTPAQIAQKAREKAKTSGLMQFQDDLQSMRDNFQVTTTNTPQLTKASGEAKQLDRSVISSQAKTTSGGINTAAMSRDTGGVALSGRETTQVKSTLAKAGGIGTEAVERESREKGYRSDDEIRAVMDKSKGAVFAIYNRALRKNPALEGKVTLELVIEPNGQVSAVKVIASELEDRSLESKLIARVRMIAFGTRDVLRTTLKYSFDFFPY